MLTHWIKWLIILYKMGKKYLPFKQNLTFVLSVYFPMEWKASKSIHQYDSLQNVLNLSKALHL